MVDFSQNPALQQLFQPVPNQPNPSINSPNPIVSKGALVMFRYSFWIHDPVPLVVVSDFSPGVRLRGVNLHYLTFPYVRNLLSKANISFSYQTIKGDAYISSSFRTYKWAGISQVKIFNSQFVLKMMAIARTFDPYQIRAIRQSVEQQIQQQMLEKAQPTIEPMQSSEIQQQGENQNLGQ